MVLHYDGSAAAKSVGPRYASFKEAGDETLSESHVCSRQRRTVEFLGSLRQQQQWSTSTSACIYCSGGREHITAMSILGMLSSFCDQATTWATVEKETLMTHRTGDPCLPVTTHQPPALADQGIELQSLPRVRVFL